MIDPEIGFTSNIIRDPNRFVGRTGLIRDCIKALNTPLGLIAIYGKRVLGNPPYYANFSKWRLEIIE